MRASASFGPSSWASTIAAAACVTRVSRRHIRYVEMSGRTASRSGSLPIRQMLEVGIAVEGIEFIVHAMSALDKSSKRSQCPVRSKRYPSMPTNSPSGSRNMSRVAATTCRSRSISCGVLPRPGSAASVNDGRGQCGAVIWHLAEQDRRVPRNLGSSGATAIRCRGRADLKRLLAKTGRARASDTGWYAIWPVTSGQLFSASATAHLAGTPISHGFRSDGRDRRCQHRSV
jgi:hypothetical protein